MPGPNLGCCCEHESPAIRERVFVLGSGFPESTFVAAAVQKPSRFREVLDEKAPGPDMPAWQGWFEGWEGRQQAQLELYAAETNRLIQALSVQLMEKFNHVEKMAFRSTSVGYDFAPVSSLPMAGREVSLKNPGSPARGSVGNRISVGVGGPPCGAIAEVPPEPKGDEGENAAPRNPMHAAFHVCGLNKAKSDKEGAAEEDESARACDVCITKCLDSVSGVLNSFQRATEPPKRQPRAALWKLVHNSHFTCMAGALIVAYTVSVGFITDSEMRAAVRDEASPGWRNIVDTTFTTCFLVELFLRMAADGLNFFNKKDWAWNAYDTGVCFIGIMDWIQIFDNANLSFLRVARTFKTLRVLRVIRVFRFFKELRLILASIVCCMASLTWAASFLVVLTYLFAVILLQGASDYIRSASTPEQLVVQTRLSEDFGSIYLAMFSLTQAVSGGRSWGEYVDPLIHISPWYGFAFTLFVMFVTFGALNILTGIFVESTSAIVSFDKELAINEQVSRKEEVVNQLRSLFKELDKDCSGTITSAEMGENLEDERVRAHFALLDMDVSEAHGLFQLLDRDESGEVSIDEFIMTCLRLKGGAKSTDLAHMLFESKRLHTFVKKEMTSMQLLVHDLHRAMKVMEARESS